MDGGVIILPALFFAYQGAKMIYSSINQHWTHLEDENNIGIRTSDELDLYKKTKIRSKLSKRNLSHFNSQRDLFVYTILLSIAVFQFDMRVSKSELSAFNDLLEKVLGKKKANMVKSLLNHMWVWDISLKQLEKVIRHDLSYEARIAMAKYVYLLFSIDGAQNFSDKALRTKKTRRLKSKEQKAFNDFCKNIGIVSSDAKKIVDELEVELYKGNIQSRNDFIKQFNEQDFEEFSEPILDFVKSFSPETLKAIRARVTIKNEKTIEEYLQQVLKVVKNDLLQLQFNNITATRKRIDETLNNRMNQGEITHTRFKKMVDETYAQIILNLNNMLSMTPLLDYAKLLKEEDETFRSNIAMVQNKEKEFKEIFLENEYAITKLDEFSNQLTVLNNKDHEAGVNMNDSMKELEYWADTSKHFGS